MHARGWNADEQLFPTHFSINKNFFCLWGLVCTTQKFRSANHPHAKNLLKRFTQILYLLLPCVFLLENFESKLFRKLICLKIYIFLVHWMVYVQKRFNFGMGEFRNLNFWILLKLENFVVSFIYASKGFLKILFTYIYENLRKKSLWSKKCFKKFLCQNDVHGNFKA